MKQPLSPTRRPTQPRKLDKNKAGKQKTASPSKPPRMRLTIRDEELLAALSDYRFLHTVQVEKLFFTSLSHARKRLSVLWQHGLVERIYQPVVPFEQSSWTVYSLSRAGAKLLAQRRECETSEFNSLPPGASRSTFFLDHTLRRNDFRICLELACRASSELELLFWKHAPEDIKDSVFCENERGEKVRVPLVADGYFGLKTPEKEVYFLVEIDRGTSTIKRMFQKMRGYYRWWQEEGPKNRFDVPNIRILTVTTSQQRLVHLLRATMDVRGDEQGSGLFWFSTQDTVDVGKPGTIMNDNWTIGTATRTNKKESIAR